MGEYELWVNFGVVQASSKGGGGTHTHKHTQTNTQTHGHIMTRPGLEAGSSENNMKGGGMQ